jgi:DNA repair exonuclease SbcCD ATPase subunit
MNVNEQSIEEAQIHVENIGGISSSTISISDTVVILAGRNATGRTSMLQAIRGVLGSEAVSLKADADEGRVELSIGDETYTRKLVRKNGSVSFEGDPYLSDVEAADCFAFLLEDNPARQAVRQGENLREIIMRPVDTDALESEISRLREDLHEINREIERLDDAETKRESLVQRQSELRTQLEEKRETLEAKERELEDADASLDESQAQKRKREENLSELQEVRSSLKGVRHELESERESLQALKEEKSETKIEDRNEEAKETEKNA